MLYLCSLYFVEITHKNKKFRRKTEMKFKILAVKHLSKVIILNMNVNRNSVQSK